MKPKFNLKSVWRYFSFFKPKQKGLIFGGQPTQSRTLLRHRVIGQNCREKERVYLLGLVFIRVLALPGLYFCGSELCVVKHSQCLPSLCLLAVSLTDRYFG